MVLESSLVVLESLVALESLAVLEPPMVLEVPMLVVLVADSESVSLSGLGFSAYFGSMNE